MRLLVVALGLWACGSTPASAPPAPGPDDICTDRRVCEEERVTPESVDLCHGWLQGTCGGLIDAFLRCGSRVATCRDGFTDPASIDAGCPDEDKALLDCCLAHRDDKGCNDLLGGPCTTC